MSFLDNSRQTKADEDRLNVFDEDLGELMAEIQASFWVEFTREDTLAVVTVGDLFDSILRKTGDLGNPSCLSSGAFYRLRRELVALSGVDRKTIKPDTDLAELIPYRRRRRWWASLETNLRLSLPRLQVPGWVMLPTLGLAIVGGILCARVAFAPSFWGALQSAMLLALGPFAAWAILLLATTPLHRAFPSKIKTIGDLARSVVARNHQKLASEMGGSTRSQAWSALQALLGDAAGIQAERIGRNMRFPEDLGIY